jgi:hypothetical protein
LKRRREKGGSGKCGRRMDAYGRRKIVYWRAGGDLWIGGRDIQSPRLKILIECGVGGVGS